MIKHTVFPKIHSITCRFIDRGLEQDYLMQSWTRRQFLLSTCFYFLGLIISLDLISWIIHQEQGINQLPFLLLSLGLVSFFYYQNAQFKAQYYGYMLTGLFVIFYTYQIGVNFSLLSNDFNHLEMNRVPVLLILLYTLMPAGFLLTVILALCLIFSLVPHDVLLDLKRDSDSSGYLLGDLLPNVLIPLICLSLYKWRAEHSKRYSFMKTRLIEKKEEEVREERVRSNQLMYTTLPPAIAQRLKDRQAIIANHFDDATVLFTSLVGFTELARRLSPEQLIELLNQVFSKLDALASKHGLHCLKTIGDTYMLVGGIPHHRSDAAYRVALLALDIRNIMKEIFTEGDLHIRIGMHRGPLTAGVIGTEKYTYDVWGDTVNFASQMDSKGTANQIQVSQAVRDSLSDKFIFQKRGFIEVKGKGKEITYFLIDEGESEQVSDSTNWSKNKGALLQRISLFQNLPKEILDSLADNIKIVPFDAQEQVVAEGDSTRSMFIVAEGVLEVYTQFQDKEIHICYIFAENFIGEYSLLTGEPRSAFVRATKKSICYEISHESMSLLMEEYPGLLDQLKAELEKRSKNRHEIQRPAE